VSLDFVAFDFVFQKMSNDGLIKRLNEWKDFVEKEA